MVIEVTLKEAIEKQGKTNRCAKKNTNTALDELRLYIVSYIIDVKIAEDEESAQSIIKKQEKDKLLAILAKKQDEKLETLTEEEIRAKLAEL